MKPDRFLDLHVHAWPDTYNRRYTIFNLGEELKANNGAAVMKSHLMATTPLAHMAREMGLPLFGSITLNQYNGGINRSVVEAAIAANGPDDSSMIIWFPTLTIPSNKPKTKQTTSHPVLAENAVKYERVSENGKLRQETREVIQLASAFNIPLATGHSSKEEVYMLIEETEKQNCKLMITHPFYQCTNFTIAEIIDMLSSSNNVYVEFAVLMSKIGYDRHEDLVEVLKTWGTDRICVSTDFGQLKNGTVTEAYTEYLTEVKKAAEANGFDFNKKSADEICYLNPTAFLGVK
ncbi:DUF6282 family protein [Bacillus sp. FSL H8-0515]|uniref:DUF6282 family protein n=1 Tax=Bacillus sp. FSL H8-0515 TaxID=2921396 RepID=UPI0030F6AAA7